MLHNNRINYNNSKKVHIDGHVTGNKESSWTAGISRQRDRSSLNCLMPISVYLAIGSWSGHCPYSITPTLTTWWHKQIQAQTTPRLARSASCAVSPGGVGEKWATEAKLQWHWNMQDNKEVTTCCIMSNQSESGWMIRERKIWQVM